MTLCADGDSLRALTLAGGSAAAVQPLLQVSVVVQTRMVGGYQVSQQPASATADTYAKQED